MGDLALAYARAERKRKKAADRRMAFLDSLPRYLRDLVNDYGVAPVMAIHQAGVREPRHFRNIIDTIRGERLDGTITYNPNGAIKNPLRDEDDGDALYVATDLCGLDEARP